jgi:hypothetical protein
MQTLRFSDHIVEEVIYELSTKLEKLHSFIICNTGKGSQNRYFKN